MSPKKVRTRTLRLPRKPSQAFNLFLKGTLQVVLRILYNYHVDARGIRGLKPPYLVIANHDMNLDPFLALSGFHKPAYIVTSEHLFRIPILGFLLSNLVGAIPKTKAKADSRTVRGMLEARRNGYPVLVYPEYGGRNWGGQTSRLIPATGKLPRLLKIPVVAIVFEGAYLATPRWCFKRRRGRITLRYHVALTAEESATLPEKEALARMQASIDHDDNLWQRKNLEAGHGVVFHARNRAEGVERSLYACPKCGTLRALHSHGDSFSCSHCGFSASIDKYGLVDGSTAMREYTVEVERILEDRAAEYLASGGSTEPFLADVMTVWSSPRMQPMEKLAHGELRLDAEGLAFDGPDGPVRLAIGNIPGATCIHAHILEFVWEDRVYRVIFDDRKTSCRLWLTAVRIFADHAKGGDSGIIED